MEAKATCQHGDWLPWLEGVGIPERTAQRMMKLAADGWKSDTVTDWGGIREALWFFSHKGAVERAVEALRFCIARIAANDLAETPDAFDGLDDITTLLDIANCAAALENYDHRWGWRDMTRAVMTRMNDDPRYGAD